MEGTDPHRARLLRMQRDGTISIEELERPVKVMTC